MDTTISKYNSLKSDLSNMKDQAARFSGKIESIKEELTTLGFDTIEKATKWLEKSQIKERELTKEITELFEEAGELVK